MGCGGEWRVKDRVMVVEFAILRGVGSIHADTISRARVVTGSFELENNYQTQK